MKTNLSLLLLFLLLFGLNSCKNKIVEEPPNLVCPIFVLEGGEIMSHEIGTEWQEPGFRCSELELGGDDLTSFVIVDTDDLDVNTQGVYYISYTATNMSGCSKTVERAVFVTDQVHWEYIGGEYSQNYNRITMNIHPYEVLYIWDVDYMYNFNGNIVSCILADLCDTNFIIVKGRFGTVNSEDLYMLGNAHFDTSGGTNGSITFYISTFFYHDDSHYSNFEITWYLSD